MLIINWKLSVLFLHFLERPSQTPQKLCYCKALRYLWPSYTTEFLATTTAPFLSPCCQLPFVTLMTGMGPRGQCPGCHGFPLAFSACPTGVHFLGMALLSSLAPSKKGPLVLEFQNWMGHPQQGPEARSGLLMLSLILGVLSQSRFSRETDDG